MVEGFDFLLILLVLGLLLAVAPLGSGESSTCLTLYREGGAPAVFQSPKCPRWKLSDYPSSPSPSTERCQLAMLQGRRFYQEDRALCALDLRIPFPGRCPKTSLCLFLSCSVSVRLLLTCVPSELGFCRNLFRAKLAYC